MKFRFIPASVLAALMFCACGNDSSQDIPDGDIDVAYLSVNISSAVLTRAPSDEEDGDADERELKSLHIVTFGADQRVRELPGTGTFTAVLTGPDAVKKPEPLKIAGSVEYILLVANPGTKLSGVLSSIDANKKFDEINSAIQAVDLSEIYSSAAGFVMINSGDEDEAQPDAATGLDKITIPLVNVSNHIEKASSHGYDETAAKTAADLNRAEIKIERLASKLGLKIKTDGPGLRVEPTTENASFDLIGWTLDAVNGTYYPWAEKYLLTVGHTSSQGFYDSNFYTLDPNFSETTAPHSGLRFTKVNTTTYEPELVHPTLNAASNNWLTNDATTYCLENTMAAIQQKYGNATRMVIKGTYYPNDTYTPGSDWFNFAGTNYEDLDELQQAYSAADPSSNLAEACQNMLDKINDHLGLALADFTDLDQSTHLDAITNGGEVIKGGKTDQVIRWYQKGLCYYYYEIRHDDQTNVEMAFGKYGVVRNNWYKLTLASIAGAGTPWYPDINEPGPGDPDPVDPIDESSGYLGIEIDVAPWIIWDREIDI